MAKEQAGLIRDEDEEENGGGREGGRRMWKRTQWRRWPQAGEAGGTGGKAGVFPLNSDCMRCMRFNHPLTHSLTHTRTHSLTVTPATPALLHLLR
jgi:hypothetical protein